MTEMVYGAVPDRGGEPILPKWWRTIDKWSMSCVMILFVIGLLLGLASSPPLAARNGFDPFHYVQRQAFFGGLALLAGTGGLLYLKGQMDRDPATPETLGMDVVFTALLLLTSLSGLALLCLRSTTLMGSLLAVHIGFVIGLFITMPYGKFVHGVYRYAALVKNAMEQAGERD